jgi:hypothetical protein
MVKGEREKLAPIVEVDESIIGALEEGNHGRGADKKSLVVKAVKLYPDSNKIGRIRLAAPLPDVSG